MLHSLLPHLLAASAGRSGSPTPTAAPSPGASASPAAGSGASPSPSPSDSGLAAALGHALRASSTPSPAAVTSCAPGDGTFCGLLRHTGLSTAWAQAVADYGVPLVKIVLVVVVAVLARRLVHHAIHQFTEHVATGERTGGWLARSTRAPLEALVGDGTVAWERRAQRARTLGSVLGSFTTAVIALLAALLVIGLLGLPLGPLLAGTSVVGVAVGFGAQSLVKDVLSGLFLIAEDQFGVGDSVDLGAGTTGTVEAVGLRTSRLRAVDGTVWYVRNGEVLKVGNRSQGWARAVVDVDVRFTEDTDAVRRAVAEAGAAVHADPAWREQLLEEPAVWGLEALTAEKVVVRLAVRTEPGQQWVVERALRRAVKERFDAAGIGHEVQAEPG